MNPKTTDRAIRLLAIPVGLMGVYVIAASIHGFYGLIVDSTYNGWEDIFAWLFVGVFMGSLFLGFGGLAIHTAIGAWRQITPSRVRRLTAFLSVALWGLLRHVLGYAGIENGATTGPTYDVPIGTGLLVVCGIFYLTLSRWLIARSSLGPEPPSPAARHWVGLFCFLLWVGLSNMTHEWSQTLPHDGDVPNFLIEMLGFFAPILVAWLLYKSIVYYQDRRYHRYVQAQPKELSFT